MQACPFLLAPTESFRHGPDGEPGGLSPGFPFSVLVGLGAGVASVLFVGACTPTVTRSRPLFTLPGFYVLFSLFSVGGPILFFLPLPPPFFLPQVPPPPLVGLNSTTSVLKFDVSNTFTQAVLALWGISGRAAEAQAAS